MKFSYSKDVDILMVQLSDEPFDYAEETDGGISHFSKEGKLVLLEIQSARKFLFSALESVEGKGGGTSAKSSLEKESRLLPE